MRWQRSSMVKGIRGYLFKMLNDNIMTDVTFVIQGTKIKTHRAIVGAREGPLRDLLKAKENRIEIDDVSPQTFRTVLRFIYTDDCAVNPENIFELMHVAKKFSLADLGEYCMKANILKVTAANVGALTAQSLHFGVEKYLAKCREYFKANTCEVINTKEFVQVPLEALVEFCSTEGISCSVTDLFAACIRWAEHACQRQNLRGSPRDLRIVLGDTLNKIRFSEMPKHHFLEFVVPKRVLTHEEVGQVIEKIQEHEIFFGREDRFGMHKVTVKEYRIDRYRAFTKSEVVVPLATTIQQLKKMKIFYKGKEMLPSNRFTLEHKGKELADDVTLASLYTPGENLTLNVHSVTFIAREYHNRWTYPVPIRVEDLWSNSVKIIKCHLFRFHDVPSDKVEYVEFDSTSKDAGSIVIVHLI